MLPCAQAYPAYILPGRGPDHRNCDLLGSGEDGGPEPRTLRWRNQHYSWSSLTLLHWPAATLTGTCAHDELSYCIGVAPDSAARDTPALLSYRGPGMVLCVTV
ncbi:hypothetical protein NDU88_004329 [Pleurodeles waltl]|uniref:Uncharacterized protein n=1 Tax=Pleurodeles waltl TaxID=8319 RepID=A0AAV7T7N5_PLEWA|nr:hypothetical protein NDU88_004329 [Pleurodeles waltl]